MNAEETHTSSWLLWCRLCARNDSHGNINIFLDKQQQLGETDSSLVATIEKYFTLNIIHDEKLPQMLCTECYSMLTSIVNFAERITKVQEMYAELQSLEECTANDENNIRTKYKLLEENQENMLIQELVPEVHYLDEKSKLTTEIRFNDLTNILSPDPLEQARIEIKTENILSNGNEITLIESDKNNDYDDYHDNDIESSEELNMEENDNNININNDDNNQTKSKDREKNIKTVDETNELPRKRQRLRQTKPVIYAEENANENKKLTKKSHSSTTKNSKDEKKYFYACTECPRKFKQINLIRHHMKQVHNKEAPTPEYKCQHCSREFESLIKLNKHSFTHIPPEVKNTLPCPYCERKFAFNSFLQSHIKSVHMDERPFICDKCGIATRTIATLQEHMLTHTNYTPFECDVCKKGFKKAKALKMHMEIHDSTKHICTECGMQLNSRATLYRHMFVHSDKMDHKCDYCGRAFKSSKTLKSHLILHTGLKPYSCDFCDRTFANGPNCRSHKKKAHPEELAAQEAAGIKRNFTPNIPKLEMLRTVTKNAEMMNLAPVASKQSGNFGKKSKNSTKKKKEQTTIVQQTNQANDTSILNQNISSNVQIMNSTTMGSDIYATTDTVAIPAIFNIYNQMQKQKQQSLYME